MFKTALGLLGRRGDTIVMRFWTEASVGLPARVGAAGQRSFLAGLPAPRQGLQEQRDGGQEIADARQVEGAVVRLGVVIQEACNTPHSQGLWV